MAKYAVTYKYLVKPSVNWSASGNLGRKNGFSSKTEAEAWVKSQTKAGKIQPLKLIDCTDINCPTTVKEYKQKATKPKATPAQKKTTAKPKATTKKATKPAPKKSTAKAKTKTATKRKSK